MVAIGLFVVKCLVSAVHNTQALRNLQPSFQSRFSRMRITSAGAAFTGTKSTDACTTGIEKEWNKTPNISQMTSKSMKWFCVFNQILRWNVSSVIIFNVIIDESKPKIAIYDNYIKLITYHLQTVAAAATTTTTIYAIQSFPNSSFKTMSLLTIDYILIRKSTYNHH